MEPSAIIVGATIVEPLIPKITLVIFRLKIVGRKIVETTLEIGGHAWGSIVEIIQRTVEAVLILIRSSAIRGECGALKFDR